MVAPSSPIRITVGLKSLIDLDTDKASTLWKHPSLEDFVETAWCNGLLNEKQYENPSPNKWKGGAYRAGQFLRSCAFQPRLNLAHELFNW